MEANGQIEQNWLGYATRDPEKDSVDGCQRHPTKEYVCIPSAAQINFLWGTNKYSIVYVYFIAVYFHELIELLSKIKVQLSPDYQFDEPKRGDR